MPVPSDRQLTLGQSLVRIHARKQKLQHFVDTFLAATFFFFEIVSTSIVVQTTLEVDKKIETKFEKSTTDVRRGVGRGTGVTKRNETKTQDSHEMLI